MSLVQLTKSRITRGIQCPKSLWLYKHSPELREVDDSLQRRFDTGTNVGILAQQLYPNGIDASEGFKYPWVPSAESTTELIAKGQSVIYEATFIANQVLVAVDILVKNEDGWHAYEVKSTNDLKEQHIPDAAIQYYVMQQYGLELKSMNIITFNRDYVRRGALDIQSLFKVHEITEEVQEMEDSLPDIISDLMEVQQSDTCPSVEIGTHCSNPYSCDFMGHCWKEVPEYSVFNLTRAGSKAWDLYEMGIEKIEDIPEEFPLSDAQAIQRDAELMGKEFINEEGIQRFLDQLVYPIYHFDFETIMPAVPMFDQSRPYQQIPFQYSLHIEQKDGSVEHREFLAESDGTDPRPKLIQNMLADLGAGVEGTILAYSSGFEKGRIKELARDFPEFETDLISLIERIQDLAIPFSKKYYYTKEMQGSYSIKAVLPALCPDLSYSDLEIQEGGTASDTFLAMIQGTFEGDIDKTRKALLEYCKMDTRAMVEVLGRLKRQVL
ncbi:DUF2779 domain-containing protein [bacterium]|nr:DUF2779 domain-containing protein [bacterium]